VTIPSFDEIVVQILGVLGVGGSIIILVGTAFAVQSWYDGARMTIAFTRKARRGIGAAGAALMSMTPIRGVAAVVITLVVPVAQVLAIGLCFLGGNYLSMIFHQERWQTAVAVIREDPEHIYDPQRLSRFLALDWISGGYVLLAVVVLVRSYRLARNVSGDSLGTAGMVLAWPAALLLFLAGVALVICLVLLLLTLLLTLVTDENDSGSALKNGLANLVPLLVGGSVCLVYYGACQAAVHGSRLVVRAWTARTVAAPGVGGPRLRTRLYANAGRLRSDSAPRAGARFAETIRGRGAAVCVRRVWTQRRGRTRTRHDSSERRGWRPSHRSPTEPSGSCRLCATWKERRAVARDGGTA
jgi:hypothetical protein